MAAGIILYNAQSDVMRPINRGLSLIKEGIETIRNQLLVFEQYRNGDGSIATHYDLLAVAGQFEAGDYTDANTAAKASYDEISSMIFKLTTNSSVSDTAAAIAHTAIAA
jgi:hypothetical protein